MELIIIITIILVFMLLLAYVYNVNIKSVKQIINNKRMKELTDRFPDNEQICKDVIKILKNEKVKIKINEDSKNKTSLYIVLTDTIFIANIKDIYTRIQTVAHECIHSIQNKKILWFNFIFTNIFNIYFIVSIILTMVKIINNVQLQISILFLMGFVFYSVRSYLENDAMIKAKYLANDYMIQYIEKNNVCTKEEVEEIINEYGKINEIGIPTYNFILFMKVIIKPVIYIVISLIINIM